MSKSKWVFRAGKVRKLKAELTSEQVEQYYQDHPDAYPVCKPPSIACLEEMARESVATAVDGCHNIEPDGHCQHGKPSWLLALGYI